MADHARSDDAAVQAQLDRLAALSPGRDILGLERISAILHRIGDPQLRLPPVFHVAGTNGKGSSAAFLAAIAQAAGLKVGLTFGTALPAAVTYHALPERIGCHAAAEVPVGMAGRVR